MQEDKFKVKNQAAVGQPKLGVDRSKPNQFEEEPDDMDEYNKRLEEMKIAERDKQNLETFNLYRESLRKTLPPRTGPQTSAQSTHNKLVQRLMDLYEPISKERNREMIG